MKEEREIKRESVGEKDERRKEKKDWRISFSYLRYHKKSD